MRQYRPSSGSLADAAQRVAVRIDVRVESESLMFRRRKRLVNGIENSYRI